MDLQITTRVEADVGTTLKIPTRELVKHMGHDGTMRDGVVDSFYETDLRSLAEVELGDGVIVLRHKTGDRHEFRLIEESARRGRRPGRPGGKPARAPPCRRIRARRSRSGESRVTRADSHRC
jgi:hypothetical protein